MIKIYLITYNATPITALLAVLAFALVAVIIFLLSRLIRHRVKVAVEHSKDLNHMMKQALSLSDSNVIVHDLQENLVTNEYGNLLPKNGMTIEELTHRLHPDDRAAYLDDVARLKKGELVTNAVYCRLNLGSDVDPNWVYLQGVSASEADNNKPRYIINMLKNVTREHDEEVHDHETALRFFHLFDINIMAMSFYDPSGKLINLNKKMRELCNFDEASEHYFRETNLFEAAMFKGDIMPGMEGEFWACQHMDYPDMGINKYIELKILPHFDDNHHILYYVVSTIDVTHLHDLHVDLQRNEKELQKASANINDYEQQLHYLLNVCDMYVWQFDLSTRQIAFSRSLKKVEFSMSREDYINDMVEEEREAADRNLMQMIMNGSQFNAIHHFTHTPAKAEPCWYALSGLPYFYNGKMAGYFGVCRDITTLMEAQEQLRRETQRAENSGLQKSAFLANMTHEIRTPLNAIVGFSDLLPMVDTVEEKNEFIRIIRNNCDMLLRLINDILEASNLESRPLTIEPVDVDFAQVFDDICQTLEQRVQNPNVKFIKDNPYTTLPTHLDKGRMQQVLTNFVTNAVKYTTEGHIRVGYCTTPLLSPEGEALPPQFPSLQGEGPGVGSVSSLLSPGLYLYCEDTGAGIPKEKQRAVFDRFVKLDEFVQGTGLGLSICKSIAERSNGAIGVISDGPGHGSTFWIWIPCPLPTDIPLSSNPNPLQTSPRGGFPLGG